MDSADITPITCFADWCFGMREFEAAAFVAGIVVGVTLTRWYYAFGAALAVMLVGAGTTIVARAIWWDDFGTWLPRAYPIGLAEFWIQLATTYGLFLAEILAAYVAALVLAFVARGGVTRIFASLAVVVVLVALAAAIWLWPQQRREALADAPLRTAMNNLASRTSHCFREKAARIDLPLPQTPSQSEGSIEVSRQVPPELAGAPVLSEGAVDLLTPIGTLRTPNFRTYPRDNSAVALTVVVGKHGETLAAIPVDGPSDLFARAVRVAKAWRFTPYLRDGEPTIVRLEYLIVPSQGPERKPTREVAFPDISDRQELYIRLLRQAPYAWNGAYALTIRGDGAMSYEGLENVALLAEHCATISQEAVDALVAVFRAANFYALDDSYLAADSFNPPTGISITIGDRTKTIVEHEGWRVGMPDAVFEIDRLIHEVTAAQRWTRGNALTGPSLVAERWNFGRDDVANRTMVAGVARHGDAKALRDLLTLGTPADTTNWPPLVSAAERGQYDMVRALLASPARWSQDDLDAAIVEVAWRGSDELVRALLGRGAGVNKEGLAKQSLLNLAAQSGVPAVVETLLKAGADIRARDQGEETALHQLEQFNPELRLESAFADRGKVVELLVRAGIPVDARDHWQHTPLIVNRTGNEGVAEALIRLGADVNAQDSDGATPLMTNDNAKATERLLAAGANPFLRDLQRRTVFDVRKEAREVKNHSAIIATIERWISTNPSQAQAAREEAARIGVSRIPKRHEPSGPGPEITPVSDGPPMYQFVEAFKFMLILIVQLSLVYGLSALAQRVVARG